MPPRTMRVLPADASNASILDLVHQWVNLIAAERIEEAQALLSVEPAERGWTPELIQELIAAYEFPYELASNLPSKITPVNTARVQDINPRHCIDRWQSQGQSGIIGTVEFDLPINEVWTDLTAVFWIKQHLEGIVLELYDIHVL